MLHLPAGGLAPAETEGEGHRHRHRAERQPEGEGHDVVRHAHGAQAHGEHEAEDGEADDARDQPRIRTAHAAHGVVGEVREPEADRDDHDPEQHLAAELDQHGAERRDLMEAEPARRLHGREQHDEEDDDAGDQLRGRRLALEGPREAELLRKGIEADSSLQARREARDEARDEPCHRQIRSRGLARQDGAQPWHSAFLLVAGEIGSLFKKGATISAAMGGCQAEIGVSSAMAAAGLAACCGADPGRVMVAAEIAMEHHLGLTCDPVGGLVQIPCIERNVIGASTAIAAARMALHRDPEDARVSLDAVICTMRETARDMSSRYKETAEGGLAITVPVALSEC